MRFRRLRLSGFKSFADAVEFRFDEGLTGIIGPNGCGKSNFMEGLRWVMGANSARALRGTEMDDVIFAGSSGRGSRNFAEVSLLIDNSARKAPTAFNDSDIIEIVRRITRGAGSDYRVNGKAARAKDVHLIFADAATGANSPALVRQGQVSELIAAKPENRRKILEDAAGIGGLASRRREAEQRLKAAEGNLTRLEDVIREVTNQHQKLKRETRTVERYRELSAQIRTLEAGLAAKAAADAQSQVHSLQADHRQKSDRVMAMVRAVAEAETQDLDAHAAAQKAQEEAAIATAIHQKAALAAERARLDAEHKQETRTNLQDHMRRLAEDQEREQAHLADAEDTLARLRAEAHEAHIPTTNETDDSLQARHDEAKARKHQLEDEKAVLHTQHLAHKAARMAAEQEVERLRTQLAALDVERTEGLQDLAALAPELKTLKAEEDTARAEVDRAQQQLTTARALQDTLEDQQRQQRNAEEAVNATRREAQDRLRQAQTEIKALAGLRQVKTETDDQPVLDQLQVKAGYERALASALGDDLHAGLDPDSPRHWAIPSPTVTPTWAAGITPLSTCIENAPQALGTRLAFIGVVDGPLPDMALAPGQRLVNRDGHLRRWDGFVCTDDAAAPTAHVLEQANRLAALYAEVPALEKGVQHAEAAYTDIAAQLKETELKVKAARAAIPLAERQLRTAERGLTEIRQALHQDKLRFETLEGQLKRLEDTTAETKAALADATARLGENSDTPDLSPQLATLDQDIEALGRVVVDLHMQLSLQAQERKAQQDRITRLQRDIDTWQGRYEKAQTRLQALAKTQAQTEAQLRSLEAAPDESDSTLEALQRRLGEAQARHERAQDAMKEAEASKAHTAQHLREQERALAQAREAASVLATQLEAAKADWHHAQEALAPYQLNDGDSEALLGALPPSAAQDIIRLQEKREALGPVNLRAAEELGEIESRLQEIEAEHADLVEAIDKLRSGIRTLNQEARTRLLKAFEVVDEHFQALFKALFRGGEAALKLVDHDDPLKAGLEIMAQPPGKRPATLSLLSGGEQALIATALIFATFLSNPAPICALDEVDAPLDDANVDRFCRLLQEMRARSDTRFVVITHNPVTMSRMDRLYGVTMAEPGISQVVRMDLKSAEALVGTPGPLTSSENA